jgi:hypothetical protein
MADHDDDDDNFVQEPTRHYSIDQAGRTNFAKFTGLLDRLNKTTNRGQCPTLSDASTESLVDMSRPSPFQERSNFCCVTS